MKKRTISITTTTLILFASFALLLFGTGYKYAEWKYTSNEKNVLTSTFFNTDNKRATDRIDFALFWEAWSTLEKKFINKDSIDPQKMFYGAIRGMVASLDDPYTFFLTPEENEQSKADLGGTFEGIGAQLGLKNNRIIVIAPLNDSPAEKAGLRTGDYIIKVDGSPTEQWTLFEAVSKIRGPGGSEVVLTVERNQKELEISIIRQEILVPSVEVEFIASGEANIAYTTLSQFGDNTDREWIEAVKEITNQNRKTKLDGMILDLRDNPGGYLDSSVFVASEFLGKGELVVKQESSVETTRNYTVERSGALRSIPLVVLINEGSASASEILAGALRDHARATLVGMKSFGKGSVQEALDLDKGAGLHVTIAKWILPNGDWINGTGIEPDIQIENIEDVENTLTDDEDLQKKEAISILLNGV